VAQHQDLCVLGDGVHVVDRRDLEDATDQAIEKAEGDGSAGSLLESCQVKPGIVLLDPSGRPPARSGGRRRSESLSTCDPGCLPSVARECIAASLPPGLFQYTGASGVSAEAELAAFRVQHRGPSQTIACTHLMAQRQFASPDHAPVEISSAPPRPDRGSTWNPSSGFAVPMNTPSRLRSTLIPSSARTKG